MLCCGWCFILSLQGDQADFLVLLLFPRSGRLICGGFREVELWGRKEFLSRARGQGKLLNRDGGVVSRNYLEMSIVGMMDRLHFK